MTEANPPAVVEDAQPAPSTTPEKPQTPRTRELSGVSLAVAVVALILAIGLAVATYFIWFQVREVVREQAGVESGVSDRIQPLRASVDGLTQSLHEQRAAIQSRIGRLDEEQQSISNRLSLLASVMGRTERGWTLAEVEYLLRIASQRLQLQRDTAGAERALEAADGRLREFADPHYLSVREQIAGDLEAVRTVPAADVDGLAAVLTSSQAGIDELPVIGTQYQPPATGDDSAHGHGVAATSIGELGELVRSSLSGLFRLREHEQAVKPMLPPDNEYFLRENLRLQLVAARVALLRADRAQYQAALETAIDWLNSYFDVSHAAVGQLAVQLEKIAAVDISPQLPDVSGSLRLLRQQMELSEQQAVLPVVPETADKAGGVPNADGASP